MEWLILALLLSLGLWWCFSQFRHIVLRFASKHWPSMIATIQAGAEGRIWFGRGATAFAIFFGYAYRMQAIRYAGLFAVYGDEDDVRRLQQKLLGTAVCIHYKVQNPNVSFLADLHDPIFEGLAVTQNPEWVNQAPEFRLVNAIRR